MCCSVFWRSNICQQLWNEKIFLEITLIRTKLQSSLYFPNTWKAQSYIPHHLGKLTVFSCHSHFFMSKCPPLWKLLYCLSGASLMPIIISMLCSTEPNSIQWIFSSPLSSISLSISCWLFSFVPGCARRWDLETFQFCQYEQVKLFSYCIKGECSGSNSYSSIWESGCMLINIRPVHCGLPSRWEICLGKVVGLWLLKTLNALSGFSVAF